MCVIFSLSIYHEGHLGCIRILEDSRLSEISQIWEDKYYLFILLKEKLRPVKFNKVNLSKKKYFYNQEAF